MRKTLRSLIVCIGASLAIAASHAPAVSEPSVVFVGVDTLNGLPSAWNHSSIVVRLENGTLLCGWTSGGSEGAIDDHVLLSRSRTGGTTWEEPWPVADPGGDTLAGMSTMFWLDGKLWLVAAFQIGPSPTSQSVQQYVMTSLDTGLTWSEPRHLDLGHERTFTLSRPVSLPGGALLFAFYWRNVGEKQPHSSAVVMSDTLKTWEVFGDIVLPDGGWSLEPAVTLRDDNVLLMHMRTNVGLLYRSTSSDFGRTWTEPQSTGIPNVDKPGLTRWDDGTLLAAMPDALERDFMSLWVSFDGGLSWPNRVVVARKETGSVAYGNPLTWADSALVSWTSYEYVRGPLEPVQAAIMFAAVSRGDIPAIPQESSPGWRVQRVHADPLPILRKVVFRDEWTGWIAGRHLWQTHDAGATWDTVSLRGYDVRAVALGAGRQMWTAFWGSPVARSMDDGAGWDFSTLNFYAPSIAFGSDSLGWTLNNTGSITNSMIWISRDGGATWTPKRFSDGLTAFADIDAGPNGTVVAAGSFGVVARSGDGGETWEFQKTEGQTYASVDMVDDSVGWIAGNAAVFRTVDRGVHWERLQTPLPFPWQALVAFDSLTAWVAGRDAIVSTTDGGKNWTSERIGAGHYLFGLSVQPDKIVAVGFNGEIWTKSLPTDVATAQPPAKSLISTTQPNPFNSRTMIRWYVPAPGPATVTVYDASGRTVRRIDAPAEYTGWNFVVWDGRDERGSAVGSGVYLYELRAAGHVVTGRMTLIR